LTPQTLFPQVFVENLREKKLRWLWFTRFLNLLDKWSFYSHILFIHYVVQMHITILSASTRLNRLSHRVAQALEKQITAQGIHTAEILDLAEYNFPVLEEVLARHPNPPAGLQDFADRVRQSDAHIFVSPEYNGGFTSALKNAVDYLKDKEFGRKAIGIATVSSGMLGGIRAALAMQQLVLGIGAYPIPQMLTVPQVSQRFDEDGALLDPGFEKKFTGFLEQFYWLAEAVAEKKQALSQGFQLDASLTR
jgi:NAD(P)H-dependent FMN reductase